MCDWVRFVRHGVIPYAVLFMKGRILSRQRRNVYIVTATGHSDKNTY
ncbi:hypothetical protein A11S_1189 [Micavibrio aeruginosavorus EPB]|uniref:Uncharacterized protein n=1 Tax=Micavibrio aeruginosavorus EPB TaxID=349215 RepID=M4VFP1_9BACT|nr:hypothetical protein A11S_1189 [Micavibrio aeruginosavorus EPB]